MKRQYIILILICLIILMLIIYYLNDQKQQVSKANELSQQSVLKSKPNKQNIIIENREKESTEKEIKDINNFASGRLLYSYQDLQDPFFTQKEEVSEKFAISSQKKETSSREIKEKEPIEKVEILAVEKVIKNKQLKIKIPFILKGIIGSDNNFLVLLSYQSKDYYLKVGDEIAEYKLIEIDKNYIKFKYKEIEGHLNIKEKWYEKQNK